MLLTDSIFIIFLRLLSVVGVIGAIDVCNIPFKAPAEIQESYIDRKLQHSIKLQAITTADKIFTNIFVGFPGSAHDTRVRTSAYFNLYLLLTKNYILGT